ncbi:dihydrofolate reductase family protein [Humidisolicoccus flavus]|uniref:dihydrofolate reductase family protein n=1 Tax=Humidisolicoccus flavus TaxID=3111414 RepID=UPI003255F7B6
MSVRNWRGRVFIGTSLDGFIAKPDGDLTWLTNPVARSHQATASETPGLEWETFIPAIDAVVMGRTTYETVLGFEAWPFAELTVIVLSTTLQQSPHASVARSLDEATTMLNDAGAREVYIDGGTVVQASLAAGLVDEITVSIAPVLIGSGAKLFGALPDDVLLTLLGHHSTPDDGLVRITYAVEHA